MCKIDRQYVDGNRKIGKKEFKPYGYCVKDGAIRKFVGNNIPGMLRKDAEPYSTIPEDNIVGKSRTWNFRTMECVDFVVLYECTEDGHICGKSYKHLSFTTKVCEETIKLIIKTYHPKAKKIFDQIEKESTLLK